MIHTKLILIVHLEIQAVISPLKSSGDTNYSSLVIHYLFHQVVTLHEPLKQPHMVGVGYNKRPTVEHN